MNLILLEDEQFFSSDSASLNQRQCEHVRTILRAKSGDSVCVGKLNGNIGSGRIDI